MTGFNLDSAGVSREGEVIGIAQALPSDVEHNAIKP